MTELLNSLSFENLQIHNPWIKFAIDSGFIVLVAAVLLFFGSTIIDKLFSRALKAFHPDEAAMVNALSKLYKRLVVLIALALILDNFTTTNRAFTWLDSTIFVLIAFNVMLSLFEIVNVGGLIVRHKAAEFEQLLNRVGKIVIATVTLMIVMRHFNYDIWHIMTALGVGTLAVGLAAQPTLTNMIAGFTILIDRPFRPGDRIALSGGEVGDVLQIGMRSTRIYTTDGNMLIVSNGELVNSRVVNFSLPNQGYGQKIKFNIDHTLAPSEVKTIVKDSIQKVPGIVKDSINVFATNMTDWGLEMGVFYKVEHFAMTANVADQIIDALVLEFRRREIKFSTLPLPVIKF